MSELVKTRQPDRAQATVNSAMLEATMRLVSKEKSITQKDIDHLVSLARDGISIEEFRKFDGPTFNLSEGNADETEGVATLLAFYM